MASFRKRFSRNQGGATLLEVLVGVAITVSVATVVGSILMTTAASGRRLQDQTDHYESLRVPASMLMQDARFAVRADCGWDFLTLYTSSSPSDYIQYQFAHWGGTADPANLHRWVVVGGALQSDEVVGWSLVPPDFTASSDATEFDCGASSSNRWARIHLVKAALPGQIYNTNLDAMAFLRTN